MTEKETAEAKFDNAELLEDLIAGMVEAMDLRYENHLKLSVLPVASRIETLATGFSSMFAMLKRNRRDLAAVEAMKCLLADSSVVQSKTPTELAKYAYLIAEAMESEADKAEQSAVEAIREATEALNKARADGSQIHKMEQPSELARRLLRKR